MDEPDPTHSLLIGIGNRLRGDDGAGYRLAEALQAEPAPTATRWRVLAVQQLTPELGAAIANADAVLFVDAWLPNTPQPAEPRLEPINGSGRPGLWPDPGGQPPGHQLSHRFSPGQLLELSGALYGRCPAAWLLLLPARQLGHGEALSHTTAQALAAGLQLVRQWRPKDA